jgi:uncharacterized protein (TIGR03435 family)
MLLLRPLPFALLLAMLQTTGQRPAPQASAKPPLAWASVSIHVNKPNGQGNYSNDQANGINERGMSLREILSEGYNFSVMPFRDEEVEGLPEWAQTTKYDIIARVDDDDAPAFKKLSDIPMVDLIAAFAARQPTGEMLMMQSLLAERFHLRVHWEPKERTVYTMTLAKGGLRMQPAADPKHGEMTFARGHLSGKGVPLSFLASLLALPAERAVVNGTGIEGSYDFDLHFAPRDGAADSQTNDADFFTAVQEQLGVKLQSGRASIPVLVVDHVEPPTAN